METMHRHLKATVNSHGLNNIIDPDYVPLNDDSTKLFNLQNTFMYSMFESCLNTTKSCHIVQTFESSAYAQSVYRELVKVHEEDLAVSL